jgi:hypothetical protein
MENSTTGLVTFADIMGWKGIWQRQGISAIDNILSVKNEVTAYGRKYLAMNLYNVFRQRYPSLPERDLGTLRQDFNPMDEAIKKLKSDNAQTNETLRADLNNLMNQNEVILEIDLISDTFIVCITSQYKMTALSMTALINRKLIESCLMKGLLIRGATSYGEYLKKESVFIGPAIDDAASWHEMGQEVIIFLAPSAFLNFEKEICESGEFVKRTVKLKGKTINSYCINWEDPSDLFQKIAMHESPMHPEVADKYLNTLDFLNSQRDPQESAGANGND